MQEVMEERVGGNAEGRLVRTAAGKGREGDHLNCQSI